MPRYDPQTSIAPTELYQRVVDGAAKLGAEHLILSGGPVTSGGQLNKTTLVGKIRALGEATRYAQSRGMSLAYHNETPEFATNGLEIKVLMRGTNPSQVHFLLDAGHAFEAGANVPSFFSK